MNDTSKAPYCNPQEASLASEARAVGRTLGKMLDCLDSINAFIVAGQIEQDAREFSRKVRDGLKADGWRIKVGARDNWVVLPPEPPKRKKGGAK